MPVDARQHPPSRRKGPVFLWVLLGVLVSVYLLCYGARDDKGMFEEDENAQAVSGQGVSAGGSLPVSQKGSMRVIGRLDDLTNGNACGVASKGSFVYLAMNESHEVVQIFDLTDPAHPRKTGYIPAAGWPKDIKVFGDVGATFSPHRDDAISAIDFRDPAHPKVLKRQRAVPMLRTPRDTFTCQVLAGAAVEGDRLFVPQPDGVKIWDMGTPEKPVPLGVVPLGGPFLIDDARAYVATGRTIVIFDIEDPKKPRELGRFDVPAQGGKVRSVTPVAAEGRHLYLTTGGGDTVLEATTRPVKGALAGIAVLDVGDPARVALEGTSFLEGVIAEFRQGALVKGKWLAVADTRFGLRVYDVSKAARPGLIASERRGGEASAVGIGGDTVYVGQNLSGGVWTVDVADKRHPRALGYLHAAMEIWGDIVPAEGNDYIYFCGHARTSQGGFWGGLHVACVRDKKRPVLVARMEGIDSYSLVRSGHLLLTGGGDILDISKPAEPRLLSSRLPSPVRSDARAMVLRGDRLYLFYPPRLFVVMDISDPLNARLVGRCEVRRDLHRMNTLAVLGDRVLLSGATNLEGYPETILKMGLVPPIPPDKDPFSKLTLIDMAHETAPKVAAEWSLDDLRFNRDWDDRLNSVNVRGDTVWVSQYSGWIQAFRWKGQRINPRPLDALEVNYWTWRTVREGKWLYCVKLMGLDIIEVK